jgi:hypothetical protein
MQLGSAHQHECNDWGEVGHAIDLERPAKRHVMRAIEGVGMPAAAEVRAGRERGAQLLCAWRAHGCDVFRIARTESATS